MSTIYRHAEEPRRSSGRVPRAAVVLLTLALVVAGLGVGYGIWYAAANGGHREFSPPAAANRKVGEPTRVEIPAIEVDAALVPVGLRSDGAMQTPEFGLAAWYRLGPRPGEPGPAVVLAHVDSKAGPDVFYRLRELEAGDEVIVHDDGGSTRFRVESTEQVHKDELPTRRIWNHTDQPVLRLITCGGEFDHATGSYRDNIIVYASRL